MMPDLSRRYRTATRALTASVVLFLAGAPLHAQQGPGAGQISPDGSAGSLSRLQEVARHLAEQHDTRVVVDPQIRLQVPPPAPGETPSMDDALDALTKPLRGVAWRQLYLPQSPEETLPPAAELAATARTLDQLGSGSLIVADLPGRRATVYLKNQPISPALNAARSRWKRSAEPIYVLYGTAATGDGRGPERRLADLQRQQLEIHVPEEQQALAMLQTMQLIQNLEPAQAEQLMRRALEAGMQVWETTSPDQRAEMIQQSFRLMQRFGAPGGDAAAGRAGGGAAGQGRPQGVPLQPAQGNRSGELKAIAATLAARDDSTILIDPDLFLSLAPKSPPADLPIEDALRMLTAPLTEVAWRKVYLTDAQLKTLKRSSAAEKLVAAVRTLDQLESGDLVLADLGTQRAITYLKSQPLSPSLDTELAQWKLSDQPVYVLYSTTPAARGGTLLERFAHLQRQQMELMLRMSPEQMAQSMEQVVQAFPSADTARRMRLMGLPVMAGMMATWFPRAAKEGQGPAEP